MIKLRGYEPKYLHENEIDNTISGGVMWENNEELYFVNPITGSSSSIHHCPFKYEDLMLGSPFKLDGQTIFEEDIVEFQKTGTKGIVKQDIHQGWIILTDRGYKYSLSDSIMEDIKIVSNSFLMNDTFRLEADKKITNETLSKYNTFLNIVSNDKNFISFIDNVNSENTFAIECVFKNKKTLNKYLKLLHNEYNDITMMLDCVYIKENILILE